MPRRGKEQRGYMGWQIDCWLGMWGIKEWEAEQKQGIRVPVFPSHETSPKTPGRRASGHLYNDHHGLKTGPSDVEKSWLSYVVLKKVYIIKLGLTEIL